MRELQISYEQSALETTVNIGKAALSEFWENTKRPFIIADESLLHLCPEQHHARTALLPAGESCKSLSAAQNLIQWLSERGCRRDDEIVALGGASIVNVAGFTASIYMRGIRWHVAPTTLLAMADSSIGGETTINIGSTKNLAGSFWQPSSVVIDPLLLKTLPRNEFMSGVGEILKTALLDGDLLYDTILQYHELICEGEPGIMEDVLYMTCGVKADIVSTDIYERGQCTVLNAGHTVAHAIESDSNYSIPHGKAVAAGLLMEAKIGKMLELTETDTVNKIEELLDLYGLEKHYGFQNDIEISIDKRSDSLLVPFITEIGTALIEKVDRRTFLDALKEIQ